jgi:hypothetical protein
MLLGENIEVYSENHTKQIIHDAGKMCILFILELVIYIATNVL